MNAARSRMTPGGRRRASRISSAHEASSSATAVARPTSQLRIRTLPSQPVVHRLVDLGALGPASPGRPRMCDAPAWQAARGVVWYRFSAVPPFGDAFGTLFGSALRRVDPAQVCPAVE